MIAHDPPGFFALLAAMTLVVYATRAGGFWLIGRVRIGRRLERMLQAMPGAVIAATVAPILLTGGVSAWFAVAAAAGTMIVVRNDFAAMLAGVAVAALVRAGGF
ncbi:MAG TPA: AzlD domain-containing protein [Pseudolabrys sp.]